jgi:hypothetical protein
MAALTGRPPAVFPRALLTAVVLLASLVAPGSAFTPAGPRVVVLISIDGLPACMWKDPTLPLPGVEGRAPREILE